jgi:hypothetical protein
LRLGPAARLGLAQQLVLARQLHLFGGPADDGAQVLQGPGLGDVVIGAQAHAAHRLGHVPARGDHHHFGGRPLGLDHAQQLLAAHPRQPDVAEHAAENALFQQFQGLLGAGASMGLESVAQGQIQALEHGGIVIDDKD